MIIAEDYVCGRNSNTTDVWFNSEHFVCLDRRSNVGGSDKFIPRAVVYPDSKCRVKPAHLDRWPTSDDQDAGQA